MAISQDILGGLRIATEKGETLKDAMITFLNAGYTKKDIEDSARVFQYEQYRKQLRQQGMSAPLGQSLIRRVQQPPRTQAPQSPGKFQPKEHSQVNIKKPLQPKVTIQSSQPFQTNKSQQGQPIQKVSSYGKQSSQPPLPPHLKGIQQTPMQRQMIQRVSSYGEQSSQPPLPPHLQMQKPEVKKIQKPESKQTKQEKKEKPKEPIKQKVSNYGEPESIKDVKKKIKTAIKHLEDIKIPKELQEKASSEEVKDVGAKKFFHRK